MSDSTPIYSAFAIVSIESIWPSFSGDEVPVNYQDLTFLSERISKGKPEDGENTSFQQRQAELAESLSSKKSELNELENQVINGIPNEVLIFSRETKSKRVGEEENISYLLHKVVSENVQEKDANSKKIALIRAADSQNKSFLGRLKAQTTQGRNDEFFDKSNNPISRDDYIKKLENEIERLKVFLDLNNVSKINNLNLEIGQIERELLDTSAYGTYPQATRRPSFSSILNSDDAYKKRRGYFKLIPLNVFQVSTSSSTAGMVGQSSFNVSFTMDDILVVADEFGANQIAGSLPRAVPIKINEVFDELERNSFGNNFRQAVRDDINKFGMYAFRISGDDFTFNIEDIVEANDTVTIWLYHEPKEFDFVDNENVTNSNQLDKYVLNKDFSYVIGSGSRKSQDDFKLLNEDGSIFKKPPRTMVQDIFVKTGILNQFSTPEVLSSDELPDTTSLTNLDVFKFLIETGRRANLDGLTVSADRQAATRVNLDRDSTYTDLAISNVVSSIVTNYNDKSRGNLFTGSLSGLIKELFLPNIPRVNRSTSISSEDDVSIGGRATKLAETPNNYKIVSQAIIKSIRDVLSSPVGNSQDAEFLSIRWDGTTRVLTYQISSFITRDEIKDIFSTIILYKKTLGELANESLLFMRDQNTNTLVTPSVTNKGFFNKRTYLKTESHGETPYLALKGHVSSVEVKYGASQGSHIVNLTGAGYEKILNDNIVYYEDLFSPTGGTFGQAIEAYPIYSQMLPPKGMLSFIEANAPRFVLIGKPSKQIIDARNMSLNFARASRPSDYRLEEDEDELNTEKTKDVFNIVDTYFPADEKQSLVRGLAAIDINIASRDRQAREEDEFFADENTGLRIFYPVNYLNTSRITEMINSLEAAYEQNPDEAVIKIPIKIAPMQSIANNLMAFNGPKEVNHLFVDETGRLRQRLAYEAWERPPMPEYTPTITDKEILISGSSFSRNSDPITTMVDIRANYLASARGIVDARFAGRTLSGGNDYIPLMLIEDEKFNNSRLLGPDSNFYEVISEPFFRYGMKYKLLNDVYTTSTRVAKRKSILYQSFFSKPLKTAKVTLKNNTSYRAGETVLVCLDSYRYRSREVIDVKKTLAWLKELKKETNKHLIPLYIGVDKRWVNNDSYYKTSTLENNDYYKDWLGKVKSSSYDNDNPDSKSIQFEEFILDAFINTFEIISNTLERLGQTNLQFITPEYFPTTLWAASVLNSPISSNITIIYSTIFDKLIGGSNSGFDFDKILKDFPDIFNYVRMQNFKATSYYIESVQHSYVHGESFTTNLNLNHGQDNLVLLEPFSMKPIGFMSTERRMRIGYDDIIIGADGNPVYGEASNSNPNPNKNTKDRMLWEDFEGKKLSDIQSLYIEQFKQDRRFKENSFLYTAQKYRNSSNFMYELSLELGLQD